MTIEQYIDMYLSETQKICAQLDKQAINNAVSLLKELKSRNGRLFILGSGGSAGNASHAVNDFRKIAQIESYAPSDNVSELTAWVNDVGWDVAYSAWLEESHFNAKDMLLVFSVGGGSDTTSVNLVKAMELAKTVDAGIIGIVSRDGGITKTLADVVLHVPVVAQERITPHAEGWQAILWHLLVNALVQV